MQKKENFLLDNEDLLFHLNNRIDYESLFEGLDKATKEALGTTSAAEFKTMQIEALTALGEICGTELAANAPHIEKEPIKLENNEVVFPPSLVKSLKALLDFGCAGLGTSTEFGGMGAPFVFEACTNELVMRACPSTGLNIVWYSAVAHIIDKFGTEALKNMTIPKIAAGEWSGCMALTEPDAGSDLANLRSYAVDQGDGTSKIYGTKRFISNGCGEVALVLAMNKKGAIGLNSINMYLCLRHDGGGNNYTISKLEEKLGLHGSATCELNFDGSKAYLLGENGKGFQHMLQLMNDARIAVALQGVGYMEAIFRLATDFAQQRKTWGKPISQHELIAEKLLDMECELRASRSLCYQAGLNQSLLYQAEQSLKDKSLSEDVRQGIEKKLAKYRKRVRRWTPLLKFYTAEKCVEMARTCLQIHGGYGYTTEYKAEWWMRESLILPIYEGTSQIQALMCIKDTLKDVIRNPKAFIEVALGTKVQTLRENDPLRKKFYRARQLENSAVISILLRLLKANARASISEAKPNDLLRMVKMLSRDLIKMENVGPALQHAERVVEIKALTNLAYPLIMDAEIDESRKRYAERFLNKMLPRIAMLKEEIEMDDPIIGGILAGYAEAAGEEVRSEGA
jgi:alkylation response protein AidB-like acyl-CoA dehydrogenase